MIAHNKLFFDRQDKNAVLEVLKKGYVAQGNEGELLEQELSFYTKIPYATLVNSGTTALYLSLYALNVSKGDEVILPTYVCSALLNAIIMIGAQPVLVDVNDEDFNINWKRVDVKLNPKTKAIIVPHIHGMPSLIPSGSYQGVPIIEDCATALGSYVGNGKKHVGNIARISVMSFYATKFCAMGYGGFVMTQDKQLDERIKNYREFDCVEEYEPRFNFQVSDLNSALGRSQLGKVTQFLERRKYISKNYDEIFIQKGIQKQTPLIDCEYNHYRYIIRIEKERREQLSDYLLSKGVKTIVPIESYELLHNYLKMSPEEFPNAEIIATTSLSLPIYPALTNTELDRIIKAIKLF